MNEKLNFLKSLKGRTGKIVFILGLAGILLIYFSSLFPKKSEKKTAPATDTTAAYCAELEQKITSLCKSISGSKRVSVVITLDSGKQYVYADEGRNSQNDSGTDREQSYTIIRSSSGEENGLLVTEYLPVVRGVAIVCASLTEQEKNEISEAVCAALDISQRKVYVTQYSQ